MKTKELVLSAWCLVLSAGAAVTAEAQEKPVLFAENVRVEQRFPWTNLVDVCFTITNTLESAKNTNVIAQVRAFYDESKALGVTNLHFASKNGQPDLSQNLTDGKVALAVDENGDFQQEGLKKNEVRLVWDAKADVPTEAEWIKTLRFTVALGLTAKEAEDADAAASRTAWLDVRTNKVYQFEDTIPVSHSAGNWANQAAVDPKAKARVMWEAAGGSKSGAGSYTDDVPLTVTLNELGQYDIIHVAKTLSSNAFTVVKRQLGTEFEPWIVSEEGKDEVRAIMRSETELCIEGDGTTMADFGGCGPWGEKVETAAKIESVYFANPDQQVSVDAFAGCTNLRVVMTRGETDDLRTQLENAGVDVEKIKFFNLNNSALVERVSVSNDKGRAKICCVVYDRDAASKEYGSNVKLELRPTDKSKTVKHLHRLENGIEYDDMMLWQKKDGRPQFVTLIWDAALDGVTAEVKSGDISVSGIHCEDTSVKVANGNFVGVLDGETGIRTWKGIPYAKQPTGEDRWKAMDDPCASSETFAAKQFGHASIQMYDKTETGGCIDQGDDCLVLNVWSSDTSVEPKEKRPVMVYIHGGAFVLGGSADIHYDGRNIVERNKDVVVVTINYRVGLMGFIDLKNVPSGENFDDSPNLAVLDQRQALIWVHENIAAFGGDPENVTIFGESAGGASVAVHMTSPDSKDLFKRAIQMSGGLDLTMTEKAYEERQLTDRLVAEVAKLRFGDVAKTNYVDMTVLQSLTVDEIRNIMATPYADMDNPGYELAPDDLSGGLPLIGAIMNYPMCDEKRGAVRADDPFTAFATNGVANGKDYMVGSTGDEWRYFMGYDGADDPLRNYYTGLISDRMRQDRVWFGADHQWRLTNFLATVECELDEMDTRYPDIWKKTQLENLLAFRLPAIRMAEIHAKLSADPESGVKGKTYMYRFDKARVYANQPWAGAGHACENDYAFHNTSGVDYGPIDESLADKVNAAFVNFARTGNPNGNGRVGEATWEEYDATGRKTMLFQNDCTTALAEDPDGSARELLMPAYDTYTKARSDAKRRTTTDTPFVRVELPAGTADDPWQVGKTAADNVIAFTNAAGRLFVEGEGDIRDFYAFGGGLWFNEATTGVEFGADVTGIGSNMLATCSGITNIVVFAAVPPTLAGETLPPTTQAFIIEVPKASVDEYKGTDGWNDYASRIQAYVWLGDKEKPWTVGDGVEAWTNGTELVIQGAGTIADLSEISKGVKDGVEKITITAVTVTGAAPLVFADVKDFALTLPDGWQGELPKDGNWYGATGVTLTKLPLTVRNVTSQQRYPWNGLVDISCDLTGAGEVKLSATVLTNGVTFIEVKTIEGETTIDLGDGCATNGVKFIWNAAKDLPAGFKASGVQLKVTAEQ